MGAPGPGAMRARNRRLHGWGPGRALCGLLLPALACSVASCAEESDRIDSDVATCSSCAIEIRNVADLGSAEGPDALGLWPVVTRDPMGRFLVADESNDASLLVFDSTGMFLQRLGGSGEGPGEYEFVRFLKTNGEHVYVFDEQRRRFTVLDTALEVVRVTRLPLPLFYSVTVLPDGSPVLASFAATGAGEAFPLHVVNDEGGIAASFGGEGEPFRPELMEERAWVITTADDGSVWATARNDYVLEQWETSGRRARRIERRPDWFDRLPPGEAQTPGHPPESRIFDLQVDSQGYLWTLSGVAATNWREGVWEISEAAWQVADPGRYYDTRIEVVDPDSGGLVAEARTDEFLYSFAGDRLAVGQSLRDGVPRAHVRGLELVGR